MPELTVTSEIYDEYDYKTKITASTEGSEFIWILFINDKNVIDK